MATSLKGNIVIVNFPFSDLSASKKRPAFVVADWGDADVILAQVTSVAQKDEYAIALTNDDFFRGSLDVPISYVRPNKLFTADRNTFLKIVGELSKVKTRELVAAISTIINAD